MLRLTIECCPLLRKFCKALFWCKTLRKGDWIGGGDFWGPFLKKAFFFHKKVPFLANIVLCYCCFPFGFIMLILYACVMNITQKLCNIIDLNAILVFIFIFYVLCTSVLLIFIKFYFHMKLCLACHVLKILFWNKAGANLVIYLIKTSQPGKFTSHFDKKSK